MTTPEEHWAGLSGDELVAELVEDAWKSPSGWMRCGFLRAAEVIEEQARDIKNLSIALAHHSAEFWGGPK